GGGQEVEGVVARDMRRATLQVADRARAHLRPLGYLLLGQPRSTAIAPEQFSDARQGSTAHFQRSSPFRDTQHRTGICPVADGDACPRAAPLPASSFDRPPGTFTMR